MLRSRRIQGIIDGLSGTYKLGPPSGNIVNAVVFLSEELAKADTIETRKRSGWQCPDEDYPYYTEEHPKPKGSPDGVCVYEIEQEDDGRPFVWVKPDRELVKLYELPPVPEWVEGETWTDEYYDESCIFCGHPSERK